MKKLKYNQKYYETYKLLLKVLFSYLKKWTQETAYGI